MLKVVDLTMEQASRELPAGAAMKRSEMATVALYPVPLPGAQPIMRQAAPGRMLAELVPGAHDAPWICRANGTWLRREYWLQRPVMPGDVIEFHLVHHGGREGSRSVLMIVAAIAAAWATPWLVGQWGILAGANAGIVQAGLTLAATALINAVLPIRLPDFGDAGAGAGGTTYNVALQGNQARLDQPIPVIYGRHRVFPDFAAQPYTEFDHSLNAQGDQFYHAYLSIGHGRFAFESIMIDDTPISRFSDVDYRVLEPGQAPTLVNPAVITSAEVGGQDMLTGKFIGGFSACPPRSLARAIGIDIVWPRGLAEYDSGGNIGNRTASFQVQYRPINDFGNILGPWVTIASESITLAIAGEVRRSYRYDLPSPMRVDVRVVRTDIKSDNQRVLNEMIWAGMRAYLSVPSVPAPQTTRLEVRIRASEQLTGLSQRRLACTVRRLLRTWSPVSGWGPEVETRSIAWALADKWTNPVYGDGLPDERIDLQTLHRLDQVWSARQDRLDIVFDTRTDSHSADQLIAQAGRAATFRRQGIMTLVRHQRDDLPQAAYTTRNMLPGASVRYLLATDETPDGVIVEYFDGRTWDWLQVECPAPGVTQMTRPVRLRLPGITGRIQAEREGLYRAAAHVYQRKFPTWQTEMDGMLPAYGTPVLFAPVMALDAVAGDVVDWDADTLTLTLSEPHGMSAGQTRRLLLVRDDGSPAPAMEVSPGPNDHSVVLPAAPDFPLVLDDGGRERPRYLLSQVAEQALLVKVLGVTPNGRSEGGAPTYTLTGVLEDDRVHAVDEFLLPVAGEVQDPVEPAPDEQPGEDMIIVNLTDQRIEFSASSGGQGAFTGEYGLRSDGRAFIDHNFMSRRYVSDQWAYPQPISAEDAGAFEVRATLESNNAGTFTGGDFGVWQPLSVDRVWVWYSSPDEFQSGSAVILIEIRDAASAIVLGSARVSFSYTAGGFGA